MVYVSVPAFRCLALSSYPETMMNCDLRVIRGNKLFPLHIDFGHDFYHNRNPIKGTGWAILASYKFDRETLFNEVDERTIQNIFNINIGHPHT